MNITADKIIPSPLGLQALFGVRAADLDQILATLDGDGVRLVAGPAGGLVRLGGQVAVEIPWAFLEGLVENPVLSIYGISDLTLYALESVLQVELNADEIRRLAELAPAAG